MERGFWEDNQTPISKEECTFEGQFDYVQREYDNEYEQHAHKIAKKYFGVEWE